MNFRNTLSDVLIPDGVEEIEAFGRITHLGIGAHPDDLEFLAFHGIVECFDAPTLWFGGITCTTGSGSPRGGAYAGLSDLEMALRRREEQRSAAQLGRYGVMVQLGYESREVRAGGADSLRSELAQLLSVMSPTVVYTHNPADSHSTHLSVLLSVVDVLRNLPPENRPLRVFGCEGWRSLDWLAPSDRVELDVSGHEDLARQLITTFDSQITGNKRYDRAILGRRSANASLSNPREGDTASQISLAVDMTELLHNDSLTVTDFVSGRLARFREEVLKALLQC